MSAGDTIWFRGSRRFVVLNRPGGLWLDRVYRSRFAGPAYYSVSAKEKAALRVTRRGTRRDVLRARKLVEASCPPWTRVEWSADGQPTYVHDASLFPKRP